MISLRRWVDFISSKRYGFDFIKGFAFDFIVSNSERFHLLEKQNFFAMLGQLKKLQLLLIKSSKDDNIILNGRVAQLGERCIRIAEAEGSTPFVSTSRELGTQSVPKCFAAIKLATRPKSSYMSAFAPQSRGSIPIPLRSFVDFKQAKSSDMIVNAPS